MSSSRSGRDTPNLFERNRERISIRSLTSQPHSTPSTSSSTRRLSFGIRSSVSHDSRPYYTRDVVPASPPPQTRFIPLSRKSTTGNRGYHLTIIQQPRTGAAYGPHYLSRVPLAPALIARLDMIDTNDRHLPVDDEIPFFVATIHLLDQNSFPVRDPPDDPSNAAAQPSAQRLLYGSLVSSPYSLFELNGTRGVFFLWPDVSIRLEGKYRLGVSLTRLRDHEMTLISSGYVTPLAQAVTEVFTVVGQNEYVAPEPTQLSRHFQTQGAPKT